MLIGASGIDAAEGEEDFNEIFSDEGSRSVFFDDVTSDFPIETFNDEDMNHSFDESNENFDEPEDVCGLDLSQDLFLFMILFNVSRRAMSHLLFVLNAHGITVPRSVYLLRSKCDKNTFRFVKELGKEDIAYRSVTDNIKFCIENNFLKLQNSVNMLTLHINIDGLPLFRSSNLNLWPMLMTIKESSYFKPLPIAVFCGIGKPNLHNYLSKLVSELLLLKKEIATICTFRVMVKDVVFICDAPARAYLQCIYGHSASYGCGYCRINGVKDFGMVFPFSGFEDFATLLQSDRGERRHSLCHSTGAAC